MAVEPEDTAAAYHSYRTNELRARVMNGVLGGRDDGDGSHGEPVIPLTYDHAPERPDETAGRCLLDAQPWDNHLGLMPQTMVNGFICKGLYVQPSGSVDREE